VVIIGDFSCIGCPDIMKPVATFDWLASMLTWYIYKLPRRRGNTRGDFIFDTFTNYPNLLRTKRLGCYCCIY
jgi:hypothetical protein